MQQTEKYNLNLIEKTDTFSPEALNENTRKVESALIAHEAAVGEVTDGLAEQTADLDARVKVFEARKIVIGTYSGASSSFGVIQEINLGFSPKALLIVNGDAQCYFTLKQNNRFAAVKITDTGFRVGNYNSTILNNNNVTYQYLAFV